MLTITLTTELEVFTCCACGIAFAMPDVYARQKRRDHADFFCPAGHSQHFPAKSDTELAQAEAAKYKKLWKEEQSYAAEVVRERNETKKQLASTKGQLTKTRQRIANGVCPECKRSFKNLHDHMQTEHPTYTEGTS